MNIDFYEEPNVGYNVYRLHFNENLFLPRAYYEEVLKVALDPDLVRYYTEPLNDGFNIRLAKFLGVDENSVFSTLGGDEALLLLTILSLHGSREVTIVEPTYSMPSAIAGALRLRVRQVLLRRGDFSLDPDDVVKAGRGSDVIYICNPNNPTGNVFEGGVIEEVVSRVDALVIIDEAYAEFAGVTSIGLTRHYENVAVLRTFSKAWGLAGLRVGYVVSSPAVINALKRVSLPHNIPYPSIAMVSKALELKHYVDESVAKMVEVREWLFRRLGELDLSPLPSRANFITFHAPKPGLVHKALVERGFVLRNLEGKVLCEDCLRATVPPRPIADRLIDALSEALKAI